MPPFSLREGKDGMRGVSIAIALLLSLSLSLSLSRSFMVASSSSFPSLDHHRPSIHTHLASSRLTRLAAHLDSALHLGAYPRSIPYGYLPLVATQGSRPTKIGYLALPSSRSLARGCGCGAGGSAIPQSPARRVGWSQQSGARESRNTCQAKLETSTLAVAGCLSANHSRRGPCFAAHHHGASTAPWTL
ncbi:hypothetical protein B0T26DRAFT_393027 [Lasiosphaeria miniovina]|uniref:Uncharacterized protein n=1 Tax=Lasiosphaeria miniovina TaxID=1954250 RepID=A0AA40DME7_9PEZI|nr:uncharacterized protein B0T26DRAFT_393027 [Lasiosphaeria miniovina]KAK0709069.1 hypothetical protein B0T26DRAFT_393027 [Lasiosphaeria miniovina]